MPRILAIDWDRHEVRSVLVSSGPTGTSIAGAWAASLTTVDPAGLSGKQIGTRLAAAMGGAVSGKPITLVGVGRDNVQMKLMTLPPAPTDELPEMVRFQAEREFTALGSEAALDFIPLSGDAETSNQVLALALSPAGITEAREVCEAIGTELDHIPMRACAAGSLVYRAGLLDNNHLTLVVNPLTDEADLVVQTGETVVLLRTVRLPDPAQAEARQRTLLGEIRRTMAAVRQQSADQQVGNVIICGIGQLATNAAAISTDLDIPVSAFDPVASAPAGLTAKGLAPESLGRFSAVLGMALNEADRRRPIVDFANVRQKQETGKITRVHILAAAAGAIAVLWLGAYMWKQLSDPAKENARIQAEIRTVQAESDKTYKKVMAQAAAVDRWLATDVTWLDELNEFAERIRPKPLSAKDFPVSEDAVITQLTLLRPVGVNPVGGRMDVQAVAKSYSAVASIEKRLRDKDHTVATGGGKLEKMVPGYEWSFDLDERVPSADDAPAAEAPKK
jgi:hypothetical protein